ncbi:MAG: 4Fe-4S dicluster domain-containing protein [Planctomycetota bacterium]
MDASKQSAILFDMVRCAGCRKCVAACMTKQGFPGDPEKVTELSATAYTFIKKKSGTNPDGDEDDYTYRNLCHHCVEPACASVCPVAALQKTPEGPVGYDSYKCIGCRYCLMACPFDIPRYEWNNPVPRVRKCDMCYDRQKEGKAPACVEACEYEATMFGTRQEMLKLAHDRIEEDPDLYLDHVYGEFEVGGTDVLFIAPFDMAKEWGFKKSLGDEPVPLRTWRVLENIPTIAITAGATMVALWWLTERRNDVQAKKAKDRAAAKRLAEKSKVHPEENGRDHV